MEFAVWGRGLRFGVWGVGCEVEGLSCGVWSLGFGVKGSGFGVGFKVEVEGLELRFPVWSGV